MSTARRYPLVFLILFALAALAAPCRAAESQPRATPEFLAALASSQPAERITKPVCGNLAQPCCQPGNTCGVSLTCLGGTCAGVVMGPCGQAGQGCCTTHPRCQSPLVCNANSICRQPCGAVGQSCCRDGSPPCGNGLTCSASGSCVVPPCGGNGQACCTSGSPCGTFLGCFSGTCHPCGDFGQVCCPGLAGDQCAPQYTCGLNNICH